MSTRVGIRLRRAGAVAASAVVITGAFATPAVAAPAGYPVLSLTGGTQFVGVTAGSAGKEVKVQLWNKGGGTATGVRLAFETKDLRSETVEFTAPKGCTQAGTVYTCDRKDLPADGHDAVIYTVKARDGGQGSWGGFIHYTLTADNHGQVPSGAGVAVQPSGVDLTVGGDQRFTKVTPGRVIKPLIWVKNQGDRAARTITLVFSMYSLNAVEKYQNCSVRQASGAHLLDRWQCSFDIDLAPGETAVLDEKTPMTFKARADIPGPAEMFENVFAEVLQAVEPAEARRTVDVPAGQARLVKTTAAAPKAEAVPGNDDQDQSDNSGTYRLATTTNPLDLQVGGVEFTGAVGSTHKFAVAAKNNGPARLFHIGDFVGGPNYRVVVTAPDGTELTTNDGSCHRIVDGVVEPGYPGGKPGKAFECTDQYAFAEVGAEIGRKYPFELKILSATAGNQGQIVAHVDGGTDPKPENNTAAIKVSVPAAPAPQPPAAAQPGDKQPDGTLPVTGSPVTLVAAGGALAVAAGTVLFVLARRRRRMTIVA